MILLVVLMMGTQWIYNCTFMCSVTNHPSVSVFPFHSSTPLEKCELLIKANRGKHSSKPLNWWSQSPLHIDGDAHFTLLLHTLYRFHFYFCLHIQNLKMWLKIWITDMSVYSLCMLVVFWVPFECKHSSHLQSTYSTVVLPHLIVLFAYELIMEAYISFTVLIGKLAVIGGEFKQEG